MANDIIGVDEPTTIDKKLDTESLVVGANTVHRERIQITGALAAEIAAILNAAPAGTEYALIVRNIPNGTQTVAGTITANAGTGTFTVGDGGGSLTIDNAALSVTGTGVESGALRVTIATDSTGLISVDDNGGSITIDGTVSANLNAGINNIGDVDVLSLPALPAGTNNIGDVDVLTLPNTAADNSTNSTSKLPVISCRANAAAPTWTEGNQVPLSTNLSGELRVTGGGGGTQYVEDDVSAVNPTGTQQIARRRDALVSETTADGDVTAVNCTAKGEIYVKQTDVVPVSDNATTLSIDDGAGSITIDGTITANAGTGTFTTDPIDRAARDLGKVDVALLDQYTPIDVDTGAGTVNALPITWRKASALGVEFGTSTDPVRTDPTGTTTQPVSGTVTANAGTGTMQVDVTDEAARDMGKIDVAALDQYTPQDQDTGVGTVNALPVVWKKSAAGAADFGTSTDPVRIDPTGTTTQPVSGTVSVTEPVSVDDNAGSLTVDAVDLDIRNLTAANDTVVANAGTGTFTTDDINNLTDNAVFTDGTSTVTPSGHIFDETAGVVLTENDVAASRIDSKRAQICTIEDETTRGRRTTVTAANALKVDASGVAVPVTDNAGSLTIDGSVGINAGVNNIGDVDVLTLPALVAGTANIGDVDVLTLPALVAGTANIGDVDIASLPTSSTSSAPAQTAQGITSAQILASNTSRKRVMIQNTGTTIIKLNLGATTVTQTAYHVALQANSAADAGDGGAYIDEMWTGAIQAISSAAGGTLVVTELT